MSFFAEVRRIDIHEREAKSLGKSSSDSGGYPLNFKPSLFRRRVKNLLVADWKLAERLLADDVDLDAPTWSMRSEELPRLEATLKTLCDALPEGFDFVASWVSEPLKETTEVSCSELLEFARASRFNGNTLYRVTPSTTPEA